MILQMLLAVVLCVFMAWERGEAIFFWRGNLLGWVLLISAASMLFRPVFYCLIHDEETHVLISYIVILEYMFILITIDSVWLAAMAFKKSPSAWFLNESSILFIGGSALFFLFAIAAGYRLTDRVWNRPQLYRRPTEIK